MPIITGHSIGGGVAALTTYLLRRDGIIPDVKCFTFSSPAVASVPLCEEMETFITAVVTDVDIAPQMTLPNMAKFQRDFAMMQWPSDMIMEHKRCLEVLQRETGMQVAPRRRSNSLMNMTPLGSIRETLSRLGSGEMGTGGLIRTWSGGAKDDSHCKESKGYGMEETSLKRQGSLDSESQATLERVPSSYNDFVVDITEKLDKTPESRLMSAAMTICASSDQVRKASMSPLQLYSTSATSPQSSFIIPSALPMTPSAAQKVADVVETDKFSDKYKFSVPGDIYCLQPVEIDAIMSSRKHVPRMSLFKPRDGKKFNWRPGSIELTNEGLVGDTVSVYQERLVEAFKTSHLCEVLNSEAMAKEAKKHKRRLLRRAKERLERKEIDKKAFVWTRSG